MSQQANVDRRRAPLARRAKHAPAAGGDAPEKGAGKMSEERNQSHGATQVRETATLGGGCFWCVEAVFNELEGVERAVSGYAGGASPNPTYAQVCSGATGHAEVVEVEFDPRVVSYKEILEVFFTVHDPTTLNRQGEDRGTQYRSVIFYHDAEQKRVAEEVIAEMSAANIWDAPIVTELAPLEAFYRAEDYHQEYFKQNPAQGYCRAVVAPKVSKFRQRYQHRLKSSAATM
ncbi:MAG TPA: peptide-methionine (S)-S-oxide reductase MsrA [Pyrinomonadaceae bacterium]|nr:peptide-methionine (S)-S-oxide reductase MsrA [Pyrinomonadaceae bacterium]